MGDILLYVFQKKIKTTVDNTKNAPPFAHMYELFPLPPASFIVDLKVQELELKVQNEELR